MHILKATSRWLLAIVLAASFLAIGWGKFTDPGWSDAFAAWGYPAGSRYAVGVVEILAGVLVLVPAVARYAAGTLAALMVGALITHAIFGNHPSFPAAQMAAVYLLMSLALWWLRSPGEETAGISSR